MLHFLLFLAVFIVVALAVVIVLAFIDTRVAKIVKFATVDEAQAIKAEAQGDLKVVETKAASGVAEWRAQVAKAKAEAAKL